MKDNKLIAEFIGMQNTNIGWYDAEEALPNIVRDTFQGNTFDHLLFHESWDWLKPVIADIKDNSLNEYHLIDKIDQADISGDRDATYKAVVEFIKFTIKTNKMKEKNKMIAEFMNLEFSNDEYYHPLYNSGDWYKAEELDYDASWDWLMPVAKKCINPEDSSRVYQIL